jgi:putative membrane protein
MARQTKCGPSLKKLTILLAVLGLALITGCTAWLGAGSVMKAILSIGIVGFGATVLAQLAVDVALGLAWHAACREIGLVHLTGARMVRDAAATCLPFSQLGGILVGIRATGSPPSPRTGGRAIEWPEAASANIIDLTTEVIGQIAFVLIAVMFLVAHQQSSPFAKPVVIGAVLLAMGIGGFIWTQQHGGTILKRLATGLSRNIASQWHSAMLNSADTLQERLDAVWSRPARIAGAAATHLVAWVGSAGAIWVAYHFLGAHLSLGGAIAIEGVACGIMSASFLVPAGLGVQEAAYMALGSAFGIDPSISLGLSLLRRGRDLAIGIPVLLVWQASEMRVLRRRDKTVVPDQPLGQDRDRAAYAASERSR